MRFYLSVVAMLVIIALPFSAMAASHKAKTVDELAKMFDSTECKSCHQDIYAQWEKSHHARPFMGVAGGLMLTPVVMGSAFTPKNAKGEPDAKAATLKTFPCFKCHAPHAAAHSEDSVAVELATALMANPQDKATVAKFQITCKVCHSEKAVMHRLQDGAPAKGVLYGSKDIPDHPGGPIKKSVIMKQAVFCGQCHGTGPNFEFENPVQCATLYGSYQHSFIPQGGSDSCQDCHMQPVNGKADHLIAPNFDDKVATQKILSDNIDLNVQTLGYQWLRKAKDLRPMVVVNTKITHKAGHRIPDGWPSHNRVVMEVTARTKDGKEVGKVEKHYHTQATTCRDEKMAYGAQNKASYVRDTSLQPFQTKAESIEFSLPEGVRTVDVTVELNYEIQTPDNKITIHKITKEVTLDR